MGVEIVKIKRFTVLKDFAHDFKNRNWLITGANGLGKSSILNFIRIALGDTDIIPPGSEGSGEVFVNKQGQTYHLKVDIKGGKSKIIITGEDGLSDTRKGMLAQIMGATSLNVTEFIELSKSEKGRKEQVEIFKSMLPKEVQDELMRLEANVKAAFEERTELARDVKRKETEIKTNPVDYLVPKELEKLKEVDVTATMTEMKTIQEANVKIKEVKDRMDVRQSEMVSQQVQIEKMKKELSELEDALKSNLNKQGDAIIWINKTENQIKSTSEYEELIKTATETNETFRNAQKIKTDRGLLTKMVADHENYTIRIETGRQAIQDAIKDMSGDLVPGVSYNEEGLTWNGLLIHPNTHSTGEQLELAMKLKMCENPDLQVMFLEHTESIDQDRMNRILEIAKDNHWQIIGEEVRRNQKEMVFEIIGE